MTTESVFLSTLFNRSLILFNVSYLTFTKWWESSLFDAFYSYWFCFLSRLPCLTSPIALIGCVGFSLLRARDLICLFTVGAGRHLNTCQRVFMWTLGTSYLHPVHSCVRGHWFCTVYSFIWLYSTLNWASELKCNSITIQLSFQQSSVCVLPLSSAAVMKLLCTMTTSSWHAWVPLFFFMYCIYTHQAWKGFESGECYVLLCVTVMWQGG